MPPTKRAVGAFVLVASLLLVAALALTAVGPTGEEGQSSYGYALTLATNATLENVTLYLPLPASDDASPIGTAIESGEMDGPVGWQYAVVQTVHGRMLRVRADEIRPRNRPDGRTYEAFDATVSVEAADAIDTRDPVESDPVLRPRTRSVTVPCPNPGTMADSTCWTFDSRLYAAYDAPDDTAVDVFVVAGGANDGSRYSERVVVSLDGPHRGWVVTTGRLQSSAGRPEWLSLRAERPAG